MSTTSPRRGGPFNFVTWSLLRLGGVLLCSVGIAQASTVATPTFSPAAGTYTSIQTVTISDSTSGATIYYTTNGSTPTTSSTHYTSPITVSSSETVKAIGTKSGYT
jgi:Chitobiase/beta-hexosaminidase C-terminal domain